MARKDRCVRPFEAGGPPPAFRGGRAIVGALLVASFLLVGFLVTALPAAGGSVPGGVGLSLTADPTNGTAPLVVAFVATLTPASTTASFNWSFGDGQYYNLSATGTSQPVHTYDSVGVYDAHVSVTSPSGNANASLTIQVVAENLVAALSATPSSGSAPLTVHFLATFSGGTGTYESILWEFGDGDIGSGPDLNYTYPVAGTFQVNLTVVDSSGHSVRDQRSIVVVSPGPANQASGSPNPLAAAVPYVLGAAVALAVAALGTISYRAAARRRAGSIEAPPGAVAGATLPPMATGPAGSDPSPAMSDWVPASEGSAVAGPAAAQDDTRRLSERLLIHLFWYGRPGPDGIARAEATQQGMARALNAGQNTISKALSRLRDAGAVKVELQHVPGAPRRVKTYSLTPRGEAVARSLTRGTGASRAVPPL